MTTLHNKQQQTTLQSKLIPILEPEFVADSVISAVLTEKQVLLLPWWSFCLIALKVSTRYEYQSNLNKLSSLGRHDRAGFYDTQQCFWV